MRKACTFIPASSTPTATSASGIQHLPLCAALAAKEGWGKQAALRAITIDAAKICRVDHLLGSIKEEKDADLAIFDGNPLEIASSVRMTIINGEVVWSEAAR